MLYVKVSLLNLVADFPAQTRLIQEALKDCGWHEAAELEQQDTSEAFSVIAGILDLPLLTLKVDIFHTGVDDDEDDHKEVNERLLNVALPEDHDPSVPLKLEDCLENYFNNRIEVTRKLGIKRSNTRSSIRSAQSHFDPKDASQHTEIAEVSWSETPTEWGESSTAPQTPTTPISPTGRHRATSIFRRMVEDEANGTAVPQPERAETPSSMRKGSMRKEVLMPAWQMYNLLRPLPFHSYITPYFDFCGPQAAHVLIDKIAWNDKKPASNDLDVLHRFEQLRPVFAICLKRYSVVDGVARKNKTFVDIPLEVGLPHFVGDEDATSENGPLMGNFKLSLQSVICHQGESLNSGHYIAFARGATQIADGDFHSNHGVHNGGEPPHYPEDVWIRHNDLANPRVSSADIDKALKEESPYLLFYKVVPLHENFRQSCSDLEFLMEASEPPAYADSGVGLKISSPTDGASGDYFDGPSNGSGPAIRFSSDLERPDPSRRSMNLSDEDRRGSTAMTETSLASTASSAGISAPPTPSEETSVQRFSRAAARIAKSGSKSRPTSASGEGRLSSTFTRIPWRISKEHLNMNEMPKEVAGAADISGQVDGAAESNRSSIVIDEHALKTDEGAPIRSKTKRGRKRDKSKEPTDQSETHHLDQHHLHKGKKDKSKMDGQKEPNRECLLM
jgi:hypothetical protein